MSPDKLCAIVSFRLGMSDGVSIVADRWTSVLDQMGYRVITVAGDGPVDHVLPSLAIDAEHAPSVDELRGVFADVDLVVVENLCSIPLNLPASRAIAEARRGLPTIMHHHDPPWQRDRFSHITELPIDDAAWRHVTINELTRRQMIARGFEATTIYNPFDVHEPEGDRARTRDLLEIDDATLLLAHPVRAIARKNIPMALRLAEQLDATYWLLGEAEDGYDDELAWLLSTASVPVIHRGLPNIADIYAAADIIAFPSLWEGFGNPPIEAALHRRPVIVGDYPVADEIEALGFTWFKPSQLDEVRHLLANPDDALLDQNREIAKRHFSMEKTQELLTMLIDDAGWS